MGWEGSAIALIERRVQTPREEANVRAIQDATTAVAFLMPTSTGLKKSILDAIAPVREFLVRLGIHDYDPQQQGPENAVRTRAFFVTSSATVPTTVSMYRPRTKQGDPRIWFRALPDHAEPGDLLALVAWKGEIYVLNATRLDIAPGSAAQEFLSGLSADEARDADELLALVRAIAASGPVPAIGSGATAVGRTLESLLGIAINSAKKPDWKTIEIKSFRASRGNRKTLFAQVPDWSLSGCKSSAEILDLMGYDRPGAVRKLYVTVSAAKENAQGLRFRLDQPRDTLVEGSPGRGISNVATWRLAMLRRRLGEKHAETFWVEADSSFVDGREYFHYRRITHTREPVIAQLEPLIAAGNLTMDHLIKHDGAKVVEKGPLFKVDAKGYQLLFPRPRVYAL
jgi:hypothetical protein